MTTKPAYDRDYAARQLRRRRNPLRRAIKRFRSASRCVGSSVDRPAAQTPPRTIRPAIDNAVYRGTGLWCGRSASDSTSALPTA